MAPGPELTQNSILRISDEKTAELIELYEREACLWNTCSEDYKMRAKRVSAAQRIAEQLDIPNFEARHVLIKFKNLRNSYSQELKKIAAATAAGDVYQPKVFWFPKMDSFLRPHLQTNRAAARTEKLRSRSLVLLPQHCEDSASRSEAEEVQFDVEVKQEATDEYWCALPTPEDGDDFAPAVAAMPGVVRPTVQGHGGKRPRMASDDMLRLLQDISSGVHALAQPQSREDPFDAFGRFVAASLRAMPVSRAQRISPRIVALLLGASTSGEERISQSDDNP